MKLQPSRVYALILFLISSTAILAAEKPRIFVLTDIENEPDDAMSMVRFLTYANHMDIEGFAATTSVHQQRRVAPQRIRRIVEAYGKVRDNLEKHEQGFPTADALLSLITEGLPVYGMNAVGEGKDSPASEALIKAADKDDPRPMWVTAWGGPNVLAQSLWKVRKTRSAEALKKFVAKIRVYTISDQDNSGPWIREQFPDLFYVASPGFHPGGAYHHATWSGISGDYFHARCPGADFSLVTNEWLEKNIRDKGPLGKEYPLWEYLMEGDTPSFLNLINNGLSNHDHPDWGGWGGRYEFYTPRMQKWFLQKETRPFWSDADDEVVGKDGHWYDTNHATIWRWREAYQNDFSARMDWTIKAYDEANHPPVAKLGHSDRLTAKPGDEIQLSAEGSSDPDGDALSYNWFYYPEPGSFTVSSARTHLPVAIKNFDQPKASFKVPTSRVMPPGEGTMHFILEVKDHGTPRLTRYQRVIVDVKKQPVATSKTRAIRFSDNLLKKNDDWFRSAEAKAIADNVIQYQSPQGGWPKSTNLAKPPASPKDIPPPGRGRANSFDNDATTVPMQYLARMAHVTGEAKYRDSFLRGLDYMLAAQYPNGGWPQFWPLRKGYYSHITYNDGSMVRVLEVIREVAQGEAPYEFVDAERRAKAKKAMSLGIDCILKTQVRQDGKLTAWCAQHDEKTLEPAWARAYEPPSLSGGESVGIVRFLMSIEEPSEEVVAAIEGAVEWLRSVRMKGFRVETVRNDDGRRERKLVRDPDAEPLWARFYELKTNRPLYLDRDSVFRYDFSEISYERRSGYSYHGTWASSVLEKYYPIWRNKYSKG